MSRASPIKAFLTCSPGSMLFIMTRPIESKASRRQKETENDEFTVGLFSFGWMFTRQRHHKSLKAGHVFV